jgi:hypothetical protein
MKKRQMND